MAREAGDFTHRNKLSSYMEVMLDLIGPATGSQTALDIPAGSGHFGALLEQNGYVVTLSDINDDKEHYVWADMNKRLPFEDQQFDVVSCQEGIEHVLDPFHLVSELSRICKVGGRVVISTPNIVHFYSRIQFLFTGTFFNFATHATRPAAPDEMVDRRHISPISYQTLRYIAGYHGLKIKQVSTDKYKRKILLPLYGLISILGWPWRRKVMLKNDPFQARNESVYQHMGTKSLSLGRTMILLFEKTNDRPAI